MNAMTISLQLIIASVLIFIISGRLIGSQVSSGKRVLSVLISVAFTTFVFWYTYLRGTDYYEQGIVSNVVKCCNTSLVW